MIANATNAGLGRLLASLLLAAMAWAAPSHAATPLGAPFTISERMNHPANAVARSASGSFVTARVELYSTGGVLSGKLLLQRHAADGSLQGAAFPADPAGTSNDIYPALAMSPSGDFVVVWSRYAGAEAPNVGHDFYAQRFSASGARIGGIQHVAHVVSFNETIPSVAMNVDGSYVVAWHAYTRVPIGFLNLVTTRVSARQYASNGQPRGAVITVDDGLPPNELISGPDGASTVAVGVDASGVFTVAYTMSIAITRSVQLRRFNADGTARGLRVRVSQLASLYDSGPSLLVNGDGTSVVAWTRCRRNGDENCALLLQRFGSGGAKQGAVIERVNPVPGTRWFAPKLAGGPNGAFVALWSTAGARNYGQTYRADGSVDGPVFMVQPDNSPQEDSANVASDANGNFVVTWSGAYYDPILDRYPSNLHGRLFLRQ